MSGTSKTQATRVWLVRHAEVEKAYQGIFGGKIDMNISELGQEQASSLAAYLEQQPISAFYSSPMKRVLQTLAPLKMRKGFEATIVPAFREVDFGEWTGHSWAAVQEKFGVSAFSWLDQLEAGTIKNSETAKQLRERVEPEIRQIISDHAGQQIAVFCHGGVIRSILSILLDWPLPRLGAFQVEYASISRIAVGFHTAELQLLNFTPWRDLPK